MDPLIQAKLRNALTQASLPEAAVAIDNLKKGQSTAVVTEISDQVFLYFNQKCDVAPDLAAKAACFDRVVAGRARTNTANPQSTPVSVTTPSSETRAWALGCPQLEIQNMLMVDVPTFIMVDIIGSGGGGCNEDDVKYLISIGAPAEVVEAMYRSANPAPPVGKVHK
ncbi:MAG: hypothetical protein HYU99_05550 [Deltaproteobacteria bacterium]|nr:hypothetical protein [Deltaproteobacteria bacterium]